MTPVDITIVSTYIAGIALGAVGYGIWNRRNASGFDWLDDVVPVFLLLLIWPIVLAVALSFCVLEAVIFIPCRITLSMMKAGAWVGNKFDDLRRRRSTRRKDPAPPRRAR